MKRYLRMMAAAVAVGLAAGLGTVSPASADVAPVKRVSCPSVAEVNRLNAPFAPSGTLVKVTATPSSCKYFIKGEANSSLEVQFVDGASTPEQAEDQVRNWWPKDYPYAFDPQPLPGLGKGAFYWADASPSNVYWQLSPGAVALMTGVFGTDADSVRVAKLFKPMMEVYTIPGERTVNGRQWRTTCEGYSATARCRTDIFGTTIKKTSSGYRADNGWVFNSLTYRWSERALWKNNRLAKTGSWTSTDGRKWRSECDTTTTGRGACRSYILSTVIGLKGGKYVQSNEWIFNNQVLFTT